MFLDQQNTVNWEFGDIDILVNFVDKNKISMSQFYMDHANDTPAANNYQIINKIKIHGSYRR